MSPGPTRRRRQACCSPCGNEEVKRSLPVAVSTTGLVRRLQLAHSTPPEPQRVSVDPTNTNTVTDDPATFAPPPLQELHHYYEPVRGPKPQRYSHPSNLRGYSQSPARRTRAESVGSGLLLFHAEAADRARVAFMPDTARPISGPPPDSSRNRHNTPVSMSPKALSTRQQRFACARLPGSPPDTSCAPFPHRSPRSHHRSRSMWRFEASPRRATPKGQQSLISCTAPLREELPNRTPLHVQDTP